MNESLVNLAPHDADVADWIDLFSPADPYAAVPAQMRAAKRWLLWKLVTDHGSGREKKMPFCVDGRPRREPLDQPADWARLASFETALRAFHAGDWSGLGFALGPDGTGGHWQGIDLDDVEDHGAQGLADQLPGYVEVSPSGGGCHAVGYGLNFATLKSNGSGIEAYAHGRFFTFTGKALHAGRTPVDISEFVRKVLEPLHSAVATTGKAAPSPFSDDDSAFLASLKLPAGATLDQVRRDFEARGPEAYVTDGAWIEWLQAVHHEFSGSDEARDLCVELSASIPGYGREADAKECRMRFDSFGRNTRANVVTYKTIEFRLRAAGIVPAREADERAAQATADDEALSSSDVRISQLLADQMVGEFLYEHGGTGWRRYQKGKWESCGVGEETEIAKRLGARILRDASSGTAFDAEKFKQVTALARRAMSASGIKAALLLAQSDPRLAAKPADFDRDADLLNVANGIVYLPTGELRPHDPTLRLVRQCPVEYVRDAGAPRWLRFLDEISDNDPDWVGYLRRALAYTLSGHVREEKLFFMLGGGANGKSVLVNVLRRILGSFAKTVSTDFLAVKDQNKDAATPTVASLPGVRMALANEVEAGSHLSAQTVKAVCSTEAIAARFLHANPFEFVPTHKLWVRGNHKPIVRDNDDGIWRRIDLIPFDRKFAGTEKDPHLEDALMAEASGILAWLVAGYRDYLRDGLRPAKRVAAASAEYRRESDLLGQWVDEAAEREAGAEYEQASAYSDYRMWCTEQGLRPVTKKSFTTGLAERGITGRQNGKRIRVYVGICPRGPFG